MGDSGEERERVGDSGKKGREWGRKGERVGDSGKKGERVEDSGEREWGIVGKITDYLQSRYVHLHFPQPNYMYTIT